MTVRYMTKIPGKPCFEANNGCDNKYGNLFVNSSCEGSQLAQEQSVCRCKFNVCHRGTKKLVSAHYDCSSAKSKFSKFLRYMN